MNYSLPKKYSGFFTREAVYHNRIQTKEVINSKINRTIDYKTLNFIIESMYKDNKLNEYVINNFNNFEKTDEIKNLLVDYKFDYNFLNSDNLSKIQKNYKNYKDNNMYIYRMLNSGSNFILNGNLKYSLLPQTKSNILFNIIYQNINNTHNRNEIVQLVNKYALEFNASIEKEDIEISELEYQLLCSEYVIRKYFLMQKIKNNNIKFKNKKIKVKKYK